MPINLWLGWSLASLFLPRLSSLAASHTGSFGTARDKRKRHMIGYDIAFPHCFLFVLPSALAIWGLSLAVMLEEGNDL